MHILTACNNCSRQFDTEGHRPGEKFHCLCGELLVVREPEQFEASVVRCSSCGGSREKNAQACGHCGADFTLIEQELNTVCPSCMARISDKAKYCHHCATPIAVTGSLGDNTEKACPRCKQSQYLASRRIKDTSLNALECNRCGGIWLDQPVFMEMEKRMIELATSTANKEHVDTVNNTPRQSTNDQNLYRQCPHCEKLMHRHNYGPGSGIIVDRCHQHGFWFDQQELDIILRWIRTGGLMASRKKRAAMQRDNDRLASMSENMDTSTESWKPSTLWKKMGW